MHHKDCWCCALPPAGRTFSWELLCPHGCDGSPWLKHHNTHLLLLRTRYRNSTKSGCRLTWSQYLILSQTKEFHCGCLWVFHKNIWWCRRLEESQRMCSVSTVANKIKMSPTCQNGDHAQLHVWVQLPQPSALGTQTVVQGTCCAATPYVQVCMCTLTNL